MTVERGSLPAKTRGAMPVHSHFRGAATRSVIADRARFSRRAPKPARDASRPSGLEEAPTLGDSHGEKQEHRKAKGKADSDENIVGVAGAEQAVAQKNASHHADQRDDAIGDRPQSKVLHGRIERETRRHTRDDDD